MEESRRINPLSNSFGEGFYSCTNQQFVMVKKGVLSPPGKRPLPPARVSSSLSLFKSPTSIESSTVSNPFSPGRDSLWDDSLTSDWDSDGCSPRKRSTVFVNQQAAAEFERDNNKKRENENRGITAERRFGVNRALVRTGVTMTLKTSKNNALRNSNFNLIKSTDSLTISEPVALQNITNTASKLAADDKGNFAKTHVTTKIDQKQQIQAGRSS